MYINREKYFERITARGLKANYLIDKTKVSRATFYKYIKGQDLAPIDFVTILANELVCTVNYITK